MLMMQRPEGEGASEFQDYTLIAIIAVAAHLTGTHSGQQQYLSALARHFSQDIAALHQVCPPSSCFLYFLVVDLNMNSSHQWKLHVLTQNTELVCTLA